MRREGKSQKQALIALARRRINVLWAIFRDRTSYNPPAAASTNSSGTKVESLRTGLAATGGRGQLLGDHVSGSNDFCLPGA
jgi:hypothetical protein